MSQQEISSDQPTWQNVVGESSTKKTLWRMWDRLSLRDGCLFRTWHEEDNTHCLQRVVPQQLRQDVLHYMHDVPSAAQLGIDKALANILQAFYWPGIKSDVEKYVFSF